MIIFKKPSEFLILVKEQLENIFSSKKTLVQCIKETNQELFKDKKTFKLKKFVDLSYNNYIAKIKHNYLIYRDNQKKNIIKREYSMF